MKKILLILTILTALLLVGCSGSTYEGDQCYDNDVCSIKEQYLGGCTDCVPDFEVQKEDFRVNLNDDNLEASVCVKNLHGEYEGDVAIRWCASDNNIGECDWQEEEVYFESQEVQGNLNINVGPGKINAWSNLNIGDEEEWACFKHEFNVNPSTDYNVHFMINDNQEIEEQNYDNNYAYMQIEGNLDLSEYLIGNDIGDFDFDGWYVDAVSTELDDNEYKFNSYEVEYENDNTGYDSEVLVAAEFSRGNAEDAFNDLVSDIVDDSGLAIHLIEINGYTIYGFDDEGIALWLSNDKFILVIMEEFESSNDLILAYLEKHPSTLVFEGILCEDSDGGKTYNVQGVLSGVYLTTGENPIDYCTTYGSQGLVEYYCVGKGYSSESINCVCENGACITTTVENGIPLFDAELNEYPMPGDSINEVIEELTEEDSDLLSSEQIESEEDIDYEQKLLVGGAEFLYDSDYEEYVIQSDDGQTPKYFYAYNVEFEDTFNPGLFVGEELELFGKNHYVIGEDSDRLVLFQSGMHTYLELNDTFEMEYEGDTYVIEFVAVNDQLDPYKVIIKVNGETEVFEEGDIKTVGGLEEIYLYEIQINTIGEYNAVAVLAFGHELELEDANAVERSGETLEETYVEMPFNNGGIDSLTVYVSVADDNGDGDLLFPGDSNEDRLFGTFNLFFEGVTANNELKAWIIENP